MIPYPEPRRVAEGGVAVFADAHLGQAEGDGEDFLAALDDVARTAGRTAAREVADIGVRLRLVARAAR